MRQRANKIIYEGQFNSELEIQSGKLIASNFTFEGIFSEGRRKCGKSTYTADPVWGNCTYEGTFLKDSWHGNGQLIQDNGLIYVGNFKGGAPSGLGLLANLAGYKGLWGLFPAPPTVKYTLGKLEIAYGNWVGKQLIEPMPPLPGITPIKLAKDVVIGVKVEGEKCSLVTVSKGKEELLDFEQELVLLELLD